MKTTKQSNNTIFVPKDADSIVIGVFGAGSGVTVSGTGGITSKLIHDPMSLK